MPTQTRPRYGVNLFVQNVEKNVEYFTQTLGFREIDRFESPDGQVQHATVAHGKGASSFAVGLSSIRGMTEFGYDFGDFGRTIQNSPGTLGNGVFFTINVPNVDKYYATIRTKGAIVDEPPTDQEWGQRTISVLTPDNYYLTFWAPIKGWKPPPEVAAAYKQAGSTTRGRTSTRRPTSRTTRRGR